MAASSRGILPVSAASVPDAPRSVMRYRLVARLLQLLHGIVEEEVDQNGIDLGLGMVSDHLPS